MSDARISTELPGHPKTKKLIRRIGHAGAWFLVRLFLWARDNRPDGDLEGMTAEDIELAVDWPGEMDHFVQALLASRFLEGEEGKYRIHDWDEHQPWSAGAEARSEKAKWAGLCKQHGRSEAARLMPDYAKRLLERASSTENSASGVLKRASRKKTDCPASASASASVSKIKSTVPDDDLFPGVPPQVLKDWKAVRKAKKLAITETAVAAIASEAEKAGMTLGQALKRAAEEGWGGFKADWVLKPRGDGKQQGSADIFDGAR